MNLGKAIQQLRKEAGYTQLQVATMAKIGLSSLIQIESGLRKPQEATLKAIAGTFNTTVAQLYVLAINEADIDSNKPRNQRIAAIKQLKKGKEIIIKALK